MALFSDLLASMFVKIDGQLKSFKWNELTSDSATILIYTEIETGIEVV